MRRLSRDDRSLLAGLVLAMIVGIGGSLALAASCLGRDRAQREPASTSPRGSDDQSSATSSSVEDDEAESPTTTTRITAAELPPAGAAAATTNAPPAEPSGSAPPPAPHTHTIETTPRPAAAVTPSPSPAPTTTAPAPTTPAPTDAIRNADAGAAVDAGTDDAGGPASAAHAHDGAAPSAPTGAGRFVTEPTNPFGASSWESNPEAGAGPFTTDRPQ